MSISIGDTDEGERVEIPVHHSAIFGATGMGKTRLLKGMMAQAVHFGWRILVFDSKSGGDEFKGIGYEAPFYIRESTHPDVIRSLLEGMKEDGGGKDSMKRYRQGFIEVCDGAKSFQDVARNLRAKLASKKIKGWTRGMYQEMFFDLAGEYGLLKLLSEFPFVDSWKAAGYLEKYRVVKVPTYKLPNLALQGLVIGSIVDAILNDTSESARKTIFVIDEAQNFISQQEGNPAKRVLQRLDREGRSREKFAWYSGQTITGISKKSLKNTWYWVMGGQLELNEAKDVYNTQTFKALTLDEIKQLPPRRFIVSTREFAKVVTTPDVEETPKELVIEGPKEEPKHKKVEETIVLAAGRGEPDGAQGEPATLNEESPEKGVPLTSSHGTKAPLNATPESQSQNSREGRDERRETKVDEPSRTLPPETINLEVKHLVLNVNHSDKIVELTTEDLNGQVVFILGESERPLSLPDVVDRAKEYGWPIEYERMRKNFNRDFIDRGLVVKDGGLYRLPRFVKFNVKRSMEVALAR